MIWSKKAVPKLKVQDRNTQFESISTDLSGLLMLIHTFMQSDTGAEGTLDKKLHQVLVNALKVRMAELGKKKAPRIL
jgi:hypothetical protein